MLLIGCAAPFPQVRRSSQGLLASLCKKASH
jgi:hypothetical protein